LLKPETYMNLSGESVVEAVRYLPLEGEDIILVLDDMDLERGRIRIRPRGGSGGHNGLRSVIEQLGTREFPRIRVGVGRPLTSRGATHHLLGKIGEQDQSVFEATLDLAVRALETILEQGVAAAMNRFNGVPIAGPEQEEEKA